MALTSMRQNVDFPEFFGPQIRTDLGLELWLVRSLVIRTCLSLNGCTRRKGRLCSSSADVFSCQILRKHDHTSISALIRSDLQL